MHKTLLSFFSHAARKSICSTCGTRYGADQPLPQVCEICADERQYVGQGGQQWTSMEELSDSKVIRITQLDASVYDLCIMPSFAIGQKAHLIISTSGNLLWDCIPFLDEATIAFIRSKGGLQAIAISHPHYYSVMTQWAQIFNCPIYIHQNDASWIKDQSQHIKLWKGEHLDLWNGMKLILVGGHFPGSCVLHLPPEEANGVLLTGDSIYVCPGRDKVSFMYSYPNMIPLPQQNILQIQARLKDIPFDTIYGAFEGQIIPKGAKAIFQQSIQRYLTIF